MGVCSADFFFSVCAYNSYSQNRSEFKVEIGLLYLAFLLYFSYVFFHGQLLRWFCVTHFQRKSGSSGRTFILLLAFLWDLIQVFFVWGFFWPHCNPYSILFRKRESVCVREVIQASVKWFTVWDSVTATTHSRESDFGCTVTRRNLI